jgi:(R,R)-butanediol dehydrogenase / meso-butanediol dehydrogenase / diacetyl reductase
VRAAVLAGHDGRLELTDLDDPVPGPGEVVARVRACGICGSDLHLATGGAAPGTVLGHEIAAEIEEVGAGVGPPWTPGAAVAARPFVGCGTCRWCASGRADHCASFAFVGYARPGGFAERVVLSARELFPLPASLTGPERALVEPLAVARHGLRRVGLGAGEPVAVLGAGPIGLATTAWARALGAGPIVVSDPVDRRRALATRLGADAVVDPVDGDVAGVCARTLGGAPPVVLECSGRPGLIERAMRLAAVDGRVGVVGACMAPDRFHPSTGLTKELDVRFALYYDVADFVETLRALDDGSLAVAGLVTDVVDLDHLPETFAAMVAGSGTGKVVVVP